ncbi:MAG: TRAP transporter small permease subunit [Dehalococcoidales bacterium]|nr:TRAP transporter small permease subunit [Dehalococcoidales bacterium]
MQTIKKILSLIDSLSKWSGVILAPLVLVYLSIIVYEIVSRYVFNSPTRWAHELGTYIFGAQFILAGAYCFWRGGFVNVEILYEKLSKRGKATMDTFMYALPLFICAVMIKYGWSFFLAAAKINEHSNTTWGPPLYPLRLMIPVGAALLLLQTTVKFVRDIHLAITGKELR